MKAIVAAFLLLSSCAPVAPRPPVVRVEIPIGSGQCLAVPGPVVVTYYGDAPVSEPLVWKAASQLLDFGTLKTLWEE